jgi:hypothetical protein
MGYSMKFGDLEVKVKRWPVVTLRRNITWAEDSAGFWQPCDRGTDGDFYNARVTAFGTKSEMENFADWIEANGRGTFTITDLDGIVFAPIVNQAGTLSATIIDLERLQRTFTAPGGEGIDEVTFTLRAVQPALVSSPAASLESLRLQEQFEHDKSTSVLKDFFQDGGAVSFDLGHDTGRFLGKFLQTTYEAKAILRYLMGTNRTAAFAFPALEGVDYPFGKARGSSLQCRAKEVKISRVSLDRWNFEIEFVEAQS